MSKNMTHIRTLYEQRKAEGKVGNMIELGRLLWPDLEQSSQLVLTHNLFSGKTKRFDFQWIPIICSWLDCTPNEFFNNYQDEKQ